MTDPVTHDPALPLLYRNPVMLDSAWHGGHRVATKDRDYAFAAGVNAVPVTLVELPQIMMHYPVVFTAGASPFPAALLGLRDGRNLFVDAAGRWAAGCYVPAYIRRYPFIFTDHGVQGGDEEATLTLCIDDVAEWLLPPEDAAQGEALFDAEDGMTPLTETALAFCTSYHAASQETRRFVAALGASDVLVDRHATIRIDGEAAFQLTGFRQVDEDRLRALPAGIVAEWHREGWLAMLYAHLLSAQHWQRLFDRQRALEVTAAASPA